jgi:hypothetical protein
MASEAPDRECWFTEVGWDLPGILLGSRTLRWIMPGTVLGAAVLGLALLG